jgi:mitochondrial chaperone BCS1
VLSSDAKAKQAQDQLDNLHHGRIALEMGIGECQFRSFDGDVFHAVYQQVGKPVGSRCGVEIMEQLILFTDGPVDRLAQFLSKLIELSEKSEEGRFICYTWNIENCYWREESKIKSRPMQSVVLPNALKQRLVNDMEKFLSPRTQDFYNRNGIPYRRSYLFYGVPGTGKTSLVQALAGNFHRSVCFLLPTHPKMTDDSLREAINQIPDDSIVVFEDIDALFSSGRQNRVAHSNLTFSGLLNALDGISNPNGQIFILTTNLRDQLDHALLRNGRVDMHVEFGYAIPEQMEQMWCNFYPDAAALASSFSQGVQNRLEEHKLQITTSALQHFFVTQMDSSAEEALEQLDSIIVDILNNSSQAMLAAATTPTATLSGNVDHNNDSNDDGNNNAETNVGNDKVDEGEVVNEDKKVKNKKKKSPRFWKKRRAEKKAASKAQSNESVEEKA